MRKKYRRQNLSWLAGLGEDWLAVIVGLGLMVLAWIGAITEAPWPLFGFLK